MARCIRYAVGGCCCKGNWAFVAGTVEPEKGGGGPEVSNILIFGVPCGAMVNDVILHVNVRMLSHVLVILGTIKQTSW